MKSTKSIASVALFIFGLACAHAQSTSQQLLQLSAELRSNPSDNTLRERILRLAQEVRPLPSMPEEAMRHIARGTAAMRAAKVPQDFAEAVFEFERAFLAAPWIADTCYNLALAKDRAGDHAGALRDLRLYLLSGPSDADAKQARALVYEIEYRQEKQTAVARRAQEEQNDPKRLDEELIKRLNGAQYVYSHQFSDGGRTTSVYQVRGFEVFETVTDFASYIVRGQETLRHGPYQIQGRIFKKPPYTEDVCLQRYGERNCGWTGTVHEERITFEFYVGGRKTEPQGRHVNHVRSVSRAR
jgi:tetratricopeptide (TPR) repeat protein